ncbi:MAG: ABC transporter ATP-binding protein [Acidobacteria bacterium]|nr:ABC transporter ATP-binding protein [Acidobacteriota bacterium]
MNSAISTDHLSHFYRKVEAVRDLTVEVPRGSLFALLGPNGAGKTTTIHTLMNILEPTSGRAEILGVDSRRLGPEQLARIGYVSENQKLPGWMTVERLLAFCKPLYPTWDDGLCNKLIRTFDLPLNRQIKSLSRGMRLKTAMIAALAYRPSLLVLDEPFGGLDVAVREELVEGMLELSEQEGWTLFISSHDLEDIENLVDHIGFIDNGRLLFSEDLEQLQARFREVEVTVPGPQQIPVPWPGDWLSPQAAGNVIRYIDSRYREGESEAYARHMFPQATNLSMSPMSLRSIFISLTRRQRAAAGEGE